MDKKLIVAAVASALALPSVSLAAIDDAGMKYISASEGLGGNVRIRLLSDTDADNSSPEVAYSSTRLFVVGDADLGGGLAATYYVEIRPDGANGEEVTVNSADVGLRGPFGWFRGGRIESASSAIIPSADRTADVGTSGEKLAGDYDNGLRWTSNDLSGLTLGASVMLVDKNGARNTTTLDPDDFLPGETDNDPAVDQFDVAAVYSLPNGVDLGAGYTNQVESVNVGGATDGTAEREDAGGVRVGVRYTQDNWGVAYNFHSYEGSNPHELTLDRTATISGSGDAAVAGTTVPVSLESRAGSDLEFTQHVFGGNVQLGKFGLTFNYALANYANDTEDWSGDGNTATDLDVDVTLLAADVSYSLGSKARMILAFKNTEEGAFDGQAGTGAAVNDYNRDVDDTTEYYVLYRVDF